MDTSLAYGALPYISQKSGGEVRAVCIIILNKRI